MKKNVQITLQSPAPLDDGGRKYNKLYYILGIIGGILGLPNGGIPGFIVGGIFGIMIAYTIKECIVSGKLGGLRRIEFSMGTMIPYEELISELIPLLAPMGMVVEKSANGFPIITYDKLIFDVSYTKNGTFTIWWRRSPLRALFIVNTKITIYRKAVVAMGIIAYHIQQVSYSK